MEPMHAGFVGFGMLDGAYPSHIFTSPTPDQMYECAQNVSNDNGVMLLIKNYTGGIFLILRRLLNCCMVKILYLQVAVINDDVAVKDSLYTAGRRGVFPHCAGEETAGPSGRRRV
ncbi:MAG: dihydroxyacetone kinase subunit DhaK [Candidatus Malihini olakiniferum]